MITLNKEIKAFTVLENTPTTFKMEVEVNTATNIDITVDRTNNNKVTATNKQGERIIVLPYLVIEAKQLADDNKPKIDLNKTNFDYHKYGKKQVLTNKERKDMILEYATATDKKVVNEFFASMGRDDFKIEDDREMLIFWTVEDVARYLGYDIEGLEYEEIEELIDVETVLSLDGTYYVLPE